MNKLPEPDDVEFFVGGVEPDATASLETARVIEEYKRRPDYRFEAEEARRILADLGINAPDYGLPDAKSLLDHWKRCVADLLKSDSEEANGKNIGVINKNIDADSSSVSIKSRLDTAVE